MSLLAPFRGLRPPAELAARIAAPPYDVVTTDEARAYASGNEASFFRISRPEIDFPPGQDEHADAVYSRGLENLGDFVARGWLVAEAEPRLYLYRQVMGDHAQVGVVAAASVQAYDEGRIKRHELTRADKEDDRTRHIAALGANDEPVFLTYRSRPEIDRCVEEGTAAAPAYDFTSEDGVRHTLWVLGPALADRLLAAFGQISTLYVADGHHRSKAASRVRELRQREGRGPGGHDRFLAVVFPHDQMQVLDYNRLVRDLHGLTPKELLARVGERFTVQPAGDGKPTRLHQFGMFLEGRWYRLEAKEGSYPATAKGSLDVSILQENVLGPLLGIGDPRRDPRIQFVGGIRGLGELERRVRSGEHAVAFALFPTTLEQLMVLSDEGEIMPPKSTWFEPKLRSGLVLHPFD